VNACELVTDKGKGYRFVLKRSTPPPT